MANNELSGCRIFIGSSSRDEQGRKLAKLIEAGLKTQGADVRYWEDVLKDEGVFREGIETQIVECDYFVMIFYPEACASDGRQFVNPNLLLETGAAWGLKGISSLIIVEIEGGSTPSDFKGVQKYAYKNNDPTALLKNIENRIKAEQKRRSAKLASNSNQLRWLSLIKCSAAKQFKVIDKIEKFKDRANTTYGVVYEEYGVLWGPPDNFMMYTVPDQINFAKFVRDFRNSMSDLATQIDSRLVFPENFWQQATPPPANYVTRQLIILDCKPHQVEKTFDDVMGMAQDEKSKGIHGVDIVKVGITTGDGDIFLITAAESENKHREFVSQHLHAEISEQLVSNTSTHPVTNFRSSQFPKF